ncbi:MAG: PAS domain S-box protein [Deltaproteobacteria bacterium]
MRDSAQSGLWFLESIDRVNRAIQGTHELEQMMRDVLDVVLDVFQADRAFLITTPADDPNLFLPTIERTTAAYPGLGDDQPLAPSAAMVAAHVRVMEAREPLAFDERELAGTGLVEHLGVRSLLVTAIHPKQMPPYVFGLHQCSRPRTWSRDERELVAEIGERISVALNALLLFRELRTSENRLAAAEALAHIGYWEIDLATNRLTLSPEARLIFGDVETGEQLRQRVYPEDRDRVTKGRREQLLEGKIVDEEARVERPDGAIRIIHTRIQLLRHADGRPRSFFATSQDVTDERAAEMMQRETEARFRTFVDHASDALFLIDTASRIIDVNQQTCESLGYTRDELLGAAPVEFDLHATPEFIEGLKQRFATEETIEFESVHRRKDGSEFPVEVRMRRFWDGERRIVGLARDITERKRAEQRLRESELRFRSMIENASDLISVINRDGIFQFQSPASLRMLGYPPELLIDKPCMDYVHPADVAKKLMALDRALAHPGTPVTVEQRVRRADGEWRVFETTAQSLPNEDEGLIVLNSRDLTDSRALEEQLRQAQKMEAIGQLAGGVAHDFNNILAAIMMQTGLSNIPGVPDEVRENLEQIQLAAERAAELTRQLLMFSRRQLMQPRDVDLNELVKSLAKMLQRIIGETVALRLDLDTQPLITRVDPGMMDQLLMNLAINSRDAMPSGGTLVIQTRRAGASIAIRVHDTGAGIAAEVLPRIFEPFFTTKEAGKGTGLGLATVFGIVQQHHGTIEVKSEPGHGTTFTVMIPIGGSGHVAATTVRTAPRGTNELVLVVEDDASVRRIIRRTLERAGYRVVDAPNGREAVQTWEGLADKPALVLTDLVMPGMSGHQVAAALRKTMPAVRVLYTSGYSAENAGKELELRTGENFVQKPFAPAALLEAVRRCLDT